MSSREERHAAVGPGPGTEAWPAPAEASETADRRARLVAVCAWCRRVRTDAGSWMDLEAYVGPGVERGQVRLADVTHGICAPCEEAATGDLGSARSEGPPEPAGREPDQRPREDAPDQDP